MDQLSYNQAIAELEMIVESLRSSATDVDTLTARTRRAVELLTVCRSRLTTTEEELRTILNSLQTPQQ
ncbi:MAG: exodeoxyribonuclease VII small subunit [Muribaculaceae bacterium]